MCYSDHLHFVKGQNISSLPLTQVCVSEVETDFSKQVASNERQHSKLPRIGNREGREKTSETSTVWGGKRQNTPITIPRQFPLQKNAHAEINEDTNWTISCN